MYEETRKALAASLLTDFQRNLLNSIVAHPDFAGFVLVGGKYERTFPRGDTYKVFTVCFYTVVDGLQAVRLGIAHATWLSASTAHRHKRAANRGFSGIK